MAKSFNKAAAPASPGISYLKTSEGWGFHPLGKAGKPSARTGEVWVNFEVRKIRDPQLLALIERYLETADEQARLKDLLGQRATELKLLTEPAKGSFVGVTRGPSAKIGLRPRGDGTTGGSDDGMFI